MGRPRYQITADDQDAAEGWIGRHLFELPPEAAQALKKASSPEDLQNIVDHFFSSAQRRRLHNSILQSRHRARKRSICVTLDGKSADELYQLAEWLKRSPASILRQLISLKKNEIDRKRNEMAWERVKAWERETGRELSYKEALALKAGQKLDK